MTVHTVYYKFTHPLPIPHVSFSEFLSGFTVNSFLGGFITNTFDILPEIIIEYLSLTLPHFEFQDLNSDSFVQNWNYFTKMGFFFSGMIDI